MSDLEQSCNYAASRMTLGRPWRRAQSSGAPELRRIATTAGRGCGRDPEGQFEPSGTQRRCSKAWPAVTQGDGLPSTGLIRTGAVGSRRDAGRRGAGWLGGIEAGAAEFALIGPVAKQWASPAAAPGGGAPSSRCCRTDRWRAAASVGHHPDVAGAIDGEVVGIGETQAARPGFAAGGHHPPAKTALPDWPVSLNRIIKPWGQPLRRRVHGRSPGRTACRRRGRRR